MIGWWIGTAFLSVVLLALLGAIRGVSSRVLHYAWRLGALIQGGVGLWLWYVYQSRAPLEVPHKLITLDWRLPWWGFWEGSNWVSRYDISLFFGADGTAMLLGLAFSLVGIVLSFWPWRLTAERLQIPAIALTQAFALWTLFAYDIITFYIGFEATLLPMAYLLFTLIPQPEAARQTTFRFLLYTLAGSIPLLIAILYGGSRMGALYGLSFSGTYHTWLKYPLPVEDQIWVYLGFVLAFYVKLGLFPLHGWMLSLYRYAPLPLVVLSSAILTKLGGVGWLRWAGAFPQAHFAVAPYVGWLSVLSILLAGLGAYFQKNLRSWLAYGTISHLGYVAVGIMATMNSASVGSAWYMVGHVIIAAAHLLTVEALITQTKTDDLDQLSGLAASLPRLTFFWILVAMASIGLPGLSQFPAEFLILTGSYQTYALQRGVFIGALLGVVVGAVYTLRVLRRVLFGASGHTPADLGLRESALMGLLALWIVGMGFVAGPFLAEIERSVIPLTEAILFQALGRL